MTDVGSEFGIIRLGMVSSRSWGVTESQRELWEGVTGIGME